MICQRKTLVGIGIILLTCYSSWGLAYGFPSGNVLPPSFTLRFDDWYDSWGFNRNYFGGSDGYLPNIAYESLGSNKDLAYHIGERLKGYYARKVELAEAILAYVQRWTDYGFDIDNVVRDNGPQAEWAWNADEMANMFDEDTNSIAIGDCEDLAFLCATIYLAAGFDVTLVSPPEHVALLIWLPEYDNANYYWDLPDDGREYGWIWVEATGEENPLGWTPPDFADGDWTIYPLVFSEFNIEFTPHYPEAQDDVAVRAHIVSAQGTVEQVLLNYSIGAINEVIQMVAQNSIYEAVIPRQPEGTEVTCSVSAIDSEGFTRDYTFGYVVGQTLQIPPFLVEIGILFFAILIIGVLLFH